MQVLSLCCRVRFVRRGFKMKDVRIDCVQNYSRVAMLISQQPVVTWLQPNHVQTPSPMLLPWPSQATRPVCILFVFEASSKWWDMWPFEELVVDTF